MDMNKFLQLKSLEQQKVNFEMAYVDMANGDLIAGLLLSQIIYWFLPDKNGKSKVKVIYKSKYALAKNREDWYSEIRVTPRQYDRGIKILQDLNIVTIENSMFNGKRTPFIILNEEIFLKLYEEETLRYNEMVIPVLPNRNTGINKTGRPLTETTTEITSKITKIINVVAPNGDNVNFFSAIFKYYFETYERYMEKVHPMLSEKYVKQIVDSIDIFSDEYEIIKADDWEKMIDMYFNSNLDCDRNIIHFAQPEILYNRASNCNLI